MEGGQVGGSGEASAGDELILPSVNEALLAQLMDFGFPEVRSENPTPIATPNVFWGSMGSVKGWGHMFIYAVIIIE